MFDREQARFNTQVTGKFFTFRTESIDEDRCFIFDILFPVVLDQNKITVINTVDIHYFTIFLHHPAVVDPQSSDQIDDPTGCGLPAIARDQSCLVSCQSGIEPRGDLFPEITGFDHVRIRPCHRSFQSPVHLVVVGESDIEDRPVIDVVDFL